MDTAQSNNFEKLLSLQEAAGRLNVSVETLISWNEHNILKPTITKTGAVGYTEQQLLQFSATIQKVIQHADPAVQIPTSPVEKYSSPVNDQRPVLRVEVQQSTTPITQTILETTSTSQGDDIKQFSSRRIISVAVLLILLTSVFTQGNSSSSSNPMQSNKEHFPNILGIQTSSLNISQQILAALPIGLRPDESSEKDLNNQKNTSVFNEKTTAPSLYTSRTETGKNSTVAAATTQQPGYKAGTKIAINPNSYTATGFFQTQTDENSAIDENGNIRGEATTDTLASVVGSIDEQSSVLQQTTSHATNQLLLIFLGMFAVLFAVQKQFALVHPGRKLPVTQNPYSTPAITTEEKILEIDQKTDGTVVLYVNGTEYKISKPEMNSESDQFIERLMSLTTPNLKEIEYDTALPSAIKFATPLSRLVTRLGFVGIKRDLFFPRTSKTSVLFRKYLTKQDLIDMNVTLDHIRNELELLS